MSAKDLALDTINKLPDNISLEEIAEKLAFMAAVQKGIESADRGDVVPLEVVEQELRCRLKS
ncbi:MAG TPA: hypothetical protein VEK08_09680 [Planctomycetota bacterium]|nr:hypothetical protein [Planctomycetota bacterium]